MATKVPNVWTLQDAKNPFSEVVRSAINTGPQTVTRRSKPAVVIVAAADYDRDSQPVMSVWGPSGHQDSREQISMSNGTEARFDT